MSRRAGIWAAGLAFMLAGPALAEPPQLAVYVTDANEDVFVALYGETAVELAGCTGETAARVLLALGSEPALEVTSFTALTAENELGAHPRIPCSEEAAFDADLPATTPIWADLTGTERYYLPAPGAPGTFYTVPLACEAIKSAFAIRQRRQLPGVLQGLSAPPEAEITREITLDCGSDTGPPPNGPPRVATDRWSLNRAETFLSETSIGDSIYVARFSRALPEGNTQQTYLPIYRINGAPAGDAIWAGGAVTEDTEAALRALFGLAADAPITALGVDGVERIGRAVYADLCLRDDCAGYTNIHAIFERPGIDLGLRLLSDRVLHTGVDLLGRSVSKWPVTPDRAVSFAGCKSLMAALGLSATAPPDWSTAVEEALLVLAGDDPVFRCSGTGSDLCVRRLADGAALTAALVSPSSDCPEATRLRIELGPTATLPGALVLTGETFSEIEIVPANPRGRTRLGATPSLPDTAPSPCLFAPIPGLIMATNLPRLSLTRLDIARTDSGPHGDVAALQVQGGTAALDAVAVLGEGSGSEAVERGLRLCDARLYMRGGQIEASALAVQGVASKITMTGTDDNPIKLRAGRFALLLTTDSTARLHATELRATGPVVLRNSTLKASRTALVAGASTGPRDALRLQPGARAEFIQSTAAGFRCVALFLHASATARFVLPGNDLRGDNDRVSCGAGEVVLLE